MNATLNIGHEVGNFTVVKYLKTYGLNNAESYRVTDAEGNDAIMKLMVDGCSSLELSQEVCELMSQTKAMPSVMEHGVINVNCIDYKYMVRESVDGVKLSELLDMGITYTWEEAVPIVMQVLAALAGLTEGYVASDIELIVNKTALAAAKKDVPLSQELLKERIPMIRKSVSESDRETYEAVRQQMESKPKREEHRRIGFVTGQ